VRLCFRIRQSRSWDEWTPSAMVYSRCDDLTLLSTTNTQVSSCLLIHPPGHNGTNVKSPSSTAASEGSLSTPRWKSSIAIESFALSLVLLRASPSSWFVSSQSALSTVASDCWSRTFPLLRRIRKDAKDAGKACFGVVLGLHS
jgi:hypothetical protein